MSNVSASPTNISILSTTESMLHHYYSVKPGDKKKFIHHLYERKKESQYEEQLAIQHMISALKTPLPEHHRRTIHFLHAKNLLQLFNVKLEPLSLEDAKIIIHNWAESDGIRSYTDPALTTLFNETKSIYQEKLESLFVQSELCMVNNIAFKSYPNAIEMLQYWMSRGVSDDLYFASLEKVLYETLMNYCRYSKDFVQESLWVAKKNRQYEQAFYRYQYSIRECFDKLLLICEHVKTLLTGVFNAPQTVKSHASKVLHELAALEAKSKDLHSPFVYGLCTVLAIIGSDFVELIKQLEKGLTYYGLDLLKVKDSSLTAINTLLNDVAEKIDWDLSELSDMTPVGTCTQDFQKSFMTRNRYFDDDFESDLSSQKWDGVEAEVVDDTTIAAQDEQCHEEECLSTSKTLKETLPQPNNGLLALIQS